MPVYHERRRTPSGAWTEWYRIPEEQYLVSRQVAGNGLVEVRTLGEPATAKTYNLDGGKYLIVRDIASSRILEIRRNGADWDGATELYQNAKLFHALLNRIDELENDLERNRKNLQEQARGQLADQSCDEDTLSTHSVG